MAWGFCIIEFELGLFPLKLWGRDVIRGKINIGGGNPKKIVSGLISEYSKYTTLIVSDYLLSELMRYFKPQYAECRLISGPIHLRRQHPSVLAYTQFSLTNQI